MIKFPTTYEGLKINMETHMAQTHSRIFIFAATAAFSTMVSGCSDANNNIPLTLDGWRDIKIGASTSVLEPLIDEDTISSTFGRCKFYSSLNDVPRATSIVIDIQTDKIISVRIGGVSKVKTHLDIDLDGSLDDVRGLLPNSHTFILNAEYTGSPIRKENMGDRVIVWADPNKRGTKSETSRGMLFQNWRSNDSLSLISVGEFKDNGDTVCD